MSEPTRPLSIRLPVSVIADLDRVATAEGRSRSNLIARLVSMGVAVIDLTTDAVPHGEEFWGCTCTGPAGTVHDRDCPSRIAHLGTGGGDGR